MPEKANGSELQPHKDYFYFDEKSLNVNKFRFENYVQIYRNGLHVQTTAGWLSTTELYDSFNEAIAASIPVLEKLKMQSEIETLKLDSQITETHKILSEETNER